MLQQKNEVMTPLEEVMHNVPNLDCGHHYININQPEPDCNSQLELEMYSQYNVDGYINEASSWMNGPSTNQWSYDREYGFPKYPNQQE